MQWVLLIRGINVGGNTIVKMADLRVHLHETGFREVKTLLQTGNILAELDIIDRSEIVALAEGVLLRHFGVKTAVIAYTADEWRDIVSENPFPNESETSGKWVQLFFGSTAEQRAAIDSFAPGYAGVETIRVTENCVFIYFSIGVGVSLLFKEKGLTMYMGGLTARNWNTTKKITDVLLG